MKFSAATVLLGSLALTNAVAIERRSTKETKTEYDQETSSFIEQGICRSYTSIANLPERVNKSISTCTKQCGKLVEGKSVACEGSGGAGIPSYTDPSGDTFDMGICVCDLPLADFIAEEVAIALPAIAEIGCEIMFDSMDLVLKVGALAIPGAGEEIDAGTAAGLKAAKAILKAGKKASTFAQWLEHPCGVSNYTAQIDNIFNPLSQASDAVVNGIKTHTT